MNSITILGRLTKDPEIRVTQSEKMVCQLTLAVNRTVKNSQGNYEADFIPVVLWGKAAELVGNSCSKGHRLLVEGRLQIRSYEAKDGGGKRYVAEIIGSHIEFIEKRDSQKAGAGGQAVQAQENSWGGMGTQVAFDEEIPF